MKYQTKQQAIEAAQAAGSAAKTFKGAAKYLIAQAWNLTPLHKRGNREAWRRGAKEARNARYLRRAERTAAALGLWAYNDALALADGQTAAICKHAARAIETAWPYRRASGRWAGGDHNVTVNLGGQSEISAGKVQAWSDNRKWSGNDSYANLTVTAMTISLFPTLLTPDGFVVIDAEKIGPNYRLTWLEQARGFALKPVSGWLVRGRRE